MNVCFDIYVLNIFIFTTYKTFNIILLNICKDIIIDILLNIYFCSNNVLSLFAGLDV